MSVTRGHLYIYSHFGCWMESPKKERPYSEQDNSKYRQELLMRNMLLGIIDGDGVICKPKFPTLSIIFYFLLGKKLHP